MTTHNPLVRISGKIVELPAADVIGGAPAGANGTDGIDGGAITIGYTFDTTTTDADPGGGTLRLNNATQNTATTIYADLLDSPGGSDWTSVLDTFDDSTNTIKGSIRLVKSGDATKFLTFNVTAVTTATGYRKITVSNTGSSASSPFANGDSILLCFDRAGDKGADGSAAGLSLVEQHTASGSSSLDFTGISSTYDTYIFELVNVQPASSGANLLLRVGTGGTPTYQTTSYNWANAISNSGGGTAFTGSASDGSIEIAASCGSGATDSVVGTIKCFDPASTTFHKRFTNQIFYANSVGSFSQRSGGGSWGSTTAVTAVRFLMSTGNIAAGTIRMYGIAK